MPASNQTDARAELGRLAASVRRHLEVEQAFGVAYVPFDREYARELRQRRRDARGADGQTSAAGKREQLEALRQEMAPCCRCGLGASRTHLVFGAGDPDADLLFIGEAPGEQEDRQGVPFVGPAGQLLTRIIEAIGLTRDRVYIANILKCRPPGNRPPLPDETAACFPFLLRQIEIVQPRIVVTLGNPATKTLLDTTQGITRMRGKFVAWNDIEVMPTFHPSYLLRAASAKRQVWEDMQKVWRRMKELGLEVGELKRGRR